MENFEDEFNEDFNIDEGSTEAMSFDDDFSIESFEEMTMATMAGESYYDGDLSGLAGLGIEEILADDETVLNHRDMVQL